MSISRAREFLADEGGGDMCRNPLALASALAKIDYYLNMVHCLMLVMQLPICFII